MRYPKPKPEKTITTKRRRIRREHASGPIGSLWNRVTDRLDVAELELLAAGLLNQRPPKRAAARDQHRRELLRDMLDDVWITSYMAEAEIKTLRVARAAALAQLSAAAKKIKALQARISELEHKLSEAT
ncbi:hypothetical protein [Acidithiobacillus sp.]|jgi:hypothetical protein|uniref:hypothetical protein n=1 Tax=Acidithiobacillus sp. TaxID=1872118 RepID=UPI0025C57797|nr:hypothetical protein [Acidithiobacillus sp.]MCK9188456.1 hypothetical protein [Acidithiobacillus sp.]MCK9358877.1 hypothetical protein [Acidithiobacillus sp.]